ncbi:hypothetical protein NBRC116188_19680 [Oceaniserpentilla sp. 4NH20-0058]|uniref:hypothetical protein n=1 Tax=Oceaniserpentilla sp. 4NH20-0058 TaxID=3127660 RepID=UPI003108E27E
MIDANGNIRNYKGKNIEYSVFDKPTRYIGSVEKIAHSDGKQEIKRYLPGGAVITIETTNSITTETIHYLHKDHLGSVDMVTDALGDIVQEMSFDLWGNRRDATDWSKMTLIELIDFNNSITTRAYTGHEAILK